MNATARRVLVLSFSQIARDPRVWRQIHFLKDEYAVTVAGHGDFDLPGVEFVCLAPRPRATGLVQRSRRLVEVLKLKARRFEHVYWSGVSVRSALSRLSGRPFDCIVANALDTLPLALRLSEDSGSKVLLDAHEYKPRQCENRFSFRLFFAEYWNYVCRTYLPRVDGMTTVCRGIADEYTRNYGVSCHVLTSAPFREDLHPSPVDPEHVRLLHHGSSARNRRPENMVAVLDRLEPRFTLDLMLLADDARNVQRIRAAAERRPRLHVIEPVPMLEIARATNAFDVGLCMFDPSSFNLRMSLPNKFFEFVQARLAVAMWPLPEMERLAREYGFGVVARECTPDAMADALNALSAQDIHELKLRAHDAAVSLCAETNRAVFLETVQALLS